MPTLLVVDDEPSILHAFSRVFKEPDVTLITAASAAQGVAAVRQDHPDVVILDIQLPDQSGLKAFGQIREFDVRIPVLFITGHGTTDMAIEAIKRGAIDYLFKPLDLTKLREVVSGAFEVARRMRVPAKLEHEDPDDAGSDIIVGRSAGMNLVYKQIGQVAPQNVPVLILGESGTGKELVARSIWNHSQRCTEPFFAVNCAAIPDTLLESELFGHEQGAFTGADRQRIGRFEQCSGGTLFLDEIGDLSVAGQAKILRVLQEQAFERVGGHETIRTDVRLIAATNRDLDQMIVEGNLRSDLYYRLSVLTIRLPALRDRGGDLVLLANYLLKQVSRELGKDILEITPETLEGLKGYHWPGNVRELQSVIKQAVLQAAGLTLIPDFLPAYIRCGDTANTDPTQAPLAFDLDQVIADQIESGTGNLYAHATTHMERHLLTKVLEHTEGNQAQAARILGITRNTLRSKIRSLDLQLPE